MFFLRAWNKKPFKVTGSHEQANLNLNLKNCVGLMLIYLYAKK